MLSEQLQTLLQRGWRLAFPTASTHRRAMQHAMAPALCAGPAHYYPHALCFGTQCARLERRLQVVLALSLAC